MIVTFDLDHMIVTFDHTRKEYVKIKTKLLKIRGEIMILALSNYYTLTMKIHSKLAHKVIYKIFTKEINSTN